MREREERAQRAQKHRMQGLCPRTPAKGPYAGPLDSRGSVTLHPLRRTILCRLVTLRQAATDPAAVYRLHRNCLSYSFLLSD